ncbi:MAG: histidine--tRNA ligase [Acidobacteria bacterium]|nr:histidine--tRNA ligase [Acidobacteriota bacterium]
MKIQSIRGTHDILPGSVELWQQVEATAHALFELYGFAEIRTPILEETELFARSIGTATDIVQKEMYTFSDSKEKQISLRPEGTAPVIRSYIENGLYREGMVHKLFYIGPMFRRERPQKGRYRQFHQIGAEVLGTDHPAADAELILMLRRFLRELQFHDYRLLINSVGCFECRPTYVQWLRGALQKFQTLCPDCRRRLEANPLRVFDCKNPACQELLHRVTPLLERLCPACIAHFDSFRRHLDQAKVDYQVAPQLVRGLDYYVRTTFEMVSDRLGPTQNALLGGGRYDGLSEAIGGPPTKGCGFALGLERFILLLSNQEELGASYVPPRSTVFLAYLDDRAFQECLRLAEELRAEGLSVTLDFEARSLKSQLRLADRTRALFTVVVGDLEIDSGQFKIKRMADGMECTVTRAQLASYMKEQGSATASQPAC